MKKILSITVIFIFFFGCAKQEKIETTKFTNSNSAQLISSSRGLIYGLKVSLGHSGTNCSGCVYVNGSRAHVDCQGNGNACQINAVMKISDSGEVNFYYGTIDNADELTYEDLFLMPDRSLYIIGSKGEFLNIPEQVAYRDEETGCFTFYDIFFSDGQVFENQ